jgi:hypothetical protein
MTLQKSISLQSGLFSAYFMKLHVSCKRLIGHDLKNSYCSFSDFFLAAVVTTLNSIPLILSEMGIREKLSAKFLPDIEEFKN